NDTLSAERGDETDDMAKKDVKAHAPHDDDDPDAGVPVAHAAKSHGARPHGAGHGHAGHGHDGPDTTEDEARDPSWWLPYAALGALVRIGVLGFCGTFNRWLKPRFWPMPGATATAEAPPVAAAPPPQPPPTTQAPPQLPPDTFGAKHLLVMHKESR